MNIRATIANEINGHAEQATAKANEAMHHAIEAGKLLLEVKASLAHGQFGAWLETNVKVSARQAQRYMAVAGGKPVPVRALSSKYDTVSHLTHEDAQAKSLAEYFKPTWEPTPGHQMLTVLNEAAYWVIPSLEHPGHFFITKLSTGGGKSLSTELEDADGESYLEFTKKPVKSVAVEMFLGSYGLKEPAKQVWASTPTEGMSRAWGDE